MPDLVSIYLDEDVSVLVGEMLRARGFDILTTRDADNLGVNDDAQLQYAVRSRRIFLTHNRVDFERLAVKYFENEVTHPGIIIAVRRPPREITLKVLTAMRDIFWQDMENQIRYI